MYRKMANHNTYMVMAISERQIDHFLEKKNPCQVGIETAEGEGEEEGYGDEF